MVSEPLPPEQLIYAKEKGATHHRDGDLYRVTSIVCTLEWGEWIPCQNAHDVENWLEELTQINY